MVAERWGKQLVLLFHHDYPTGHVVGHNLCLRGMGGGGVLVMDQLLVGVMIAGPALMLNGDDTRG